VPVVSVVSHLLKGHRRAQHGAGEFFSTLGILLAHAHLVVRGKPAKMGEGSCLPSWRQPSMRLRNASESACWRTRNSSTARRNPQQAAARESQAGARTVQRVRNAPSATSTCTCGLKKSDERSPL